MSTIKPVYVMNERGLSTLEKKAVLEGIQELLQIVEISNLIKILDLGAWRDKDYLDENGSLREFRSVDWYIKSGRIESRNTTQLNGGSIMDSLTFEPWRKNQPHYDVCITAKDMYMGDTNFVIGLAREGIGTVISVYRFKGLDANLEFECIKTETMHEVGHVFGLIPYYRTKDVEQSLGKHCTNKCIMRQGLRLPIDWIKMTEDRLKHGALCRTCTSDLKRYFKG